MKNNVYKNLLCVSLFVGQNAMAQRNVDSFVNTLHNSDAKSILAWVAPANRPDSTKLYASSIERILTNMNIREIKRDYPKYLLVRALVQCLIDTERDWYADLLLYSLADKHSGNIITCDAREQWLNSPINGDTTHKAIDVEMWHKYLVSLSSSEKW